MDTKEVRKFAAECLLLAKTATTAEDAVKLREMAREMIEVADGEGPPPTDQQQQN